MDSPLRTSALSSPDFCKTTPELAQRSSSHSLRLKQTPPGRQSLRSHLMPDTERDQSPIKDLDRKMSPFKMQVQSNIQSKLNY